MYAMRYENEYKLGYKRPFWGTHYHGYGDPRFLIWVGYWNSGADPGWSVRGGGADKIGSKWADFTRFWPILEGAAPPRPLLDPPLHIFPF